jgi:hypothetical protein
MVPSIVGGKLPFTNSQFNVKRPNIRGANTKCEGNFRFIIE